MEERLSAPLSERMLELARVSPGARVLDLATGRGEPAIRAARRVSPNGLVVGVDPQASMLQMARERATREDVRNLELRVMKAEALTDVACFDVALSRWGLMYMDDPVAALRAARRALVDGGALVVAVWVEPDRVSYWSLPRRALAKHVPLPPIDFDAGTFRYADREKLARDLGAVGFSVTHEEEMSIPVMEATSDEELVAWTRAFGMEKLVSTLPLSTQREWEAELVRAAAALRESGVVRLGGVTRIIVAA